MTSFDKICQKYMTEYVRIQTCDLWVTDVLEALLFSVRWRKKNIYIFQTMDKSPLFKIFATTTAVAINTTLNLNGTTATCPL
jgi:hypothetical protein